jgi:hypothetical protein
LIPIPPFLRGVRGDLKVPKVTAKDFSKGVFQMCKNLDSPHPLTPSPIFGRRGTRIMPPLSHMKGEGLGVREKI